MTAQAQCIPAEEVQRALKAAGNFYFGPVDNIFGAESQTGLRQWLDFRTEDVQWSVSSGRTQVCFQTQTTGVVAVTGALRDLAKLRPLTPDEQASITSRGAVSRIESQPQRTGTVVARAGTQSSGVDLSRIQPAWVINWGTWIPVIAGVTILAGLIWWGSRRRSPKGYA